MAGQAVHDFIDSKGASYAGKVIAQFLEQLVEAFFIIGTAIILLVMRLFLMRSS